MKHTKIYLLIILLITALSGYAQQSKVRGKVIDENGEPMIGVSVIIKNQPGLGVITDTNGDYQLNVDPNDVLVFTFIGYTQQSILANKPVINVEMVPSTTSLDEVTVVGSGTQRKVSVVGAISTVEVPTLSRSSVNLSNSLAGNVAGIIARQISGEPGNNVSEFWIRGKSTFGASSSALVLVDGIERDFNELNVEDIESFSVLKDASATAIYGQRGANGVLIITTKRGKEGKVNINVKVETGINQSTRVPSYVDATRYAELANEAYMSRGKSPKYSNEEMDIIRYGLDPDLYPNIDWYDEIMKKSTNNRKILINLSGGGSIARYYVSAGIYGEDGMYKADNLNKYNTNSNYNRYNFRSNVDMNITKSTLLEVGVSGWVSTQNKPGTSSDDIWKSLASIPAITVPKVYSNGLFPTYGTGEQTNPWVLLTQTGYNETWDSKLETNVAITQNLDFITKGLKFYTRFSYDAYNWNQVTRSKGVDLYRAEPQRDGDGNLILRKISNGFPLTQSTAAWGDRRIYFEANLDYNRTFKEKHRVTGLLLFYLQEYQRNDAGSNIFAAVPKKNVAFSGRGTYSYDDRYFVEFNFGYTGSENFDKKNRFGFFPAIAGGWMLSNENFIKDNITFINQFKIRYSYGLVGNDVMNSRFPYLNTIVNSPGYIFGENGQNSVGGIGIDINGTQNLTWEVAKKHNLGFDIGLFDKFNLTLDLFKDTRENIFLQRNSIPGNVGLIGQNPWANVGVQDNIGFDGSASFIQKIGSAILTLRGNIVFTKSDIRKFDEAANALYYQKTEGYRLGQTRGLIALGLFRDEYDIKNSPTQTFGDVEPGDIKYKDVNGDGIIDGKDVVPIGYQTIPALLYGAGASLEWNNFDFNILFQGSGRSDFFVGGNGVYPFNDGEMGNILTAVSHDEDRWIPREVSGTPETERADATFPRLTYGKNENNNRASTFWLRDASYLRLKNVEIGYTIPQALTRKIKIDKVRVYLMGDNLAVFSPFKWWDPELANENGTKYPIQRNISLGLTVSL